MYQCKINEKWGRALQATQLCRSQSKNSPVEKDVAIVSVFDLKEIAYQAVSRAALNEISLRRQELLRYRFTELFQEVIQ